MKVLYIFLCAALLHSSQSQFLSRFGWGRQSATAEVTVPPQTSAVENNLIGLIQNSAAASQAVVDATANAKLAALSSAGLAGTIGAGAAQAGIIAGTAGSRAGIGAASLAVRAPLAMGVMAGNAMSAGSRLASSGVGMASSLGQSAVSTAGRLALNAVTGFDGSYQMMINMMQMAIRMISNAINAYISVVSGAAINGVQAPRMIMNVMQRLAVNSPLSGAIQQIMQLVQAPRFRHLISGIQRAISQNDPMQIVNVLMNNLTLLPEIIARVSSVARTVSSTLESTYRDMVQEIKKAFEKIQEAINSIKEAAKETVNKALNDVMDRIRAQKDDILGSIDYAIENVRSLSTPEQVQDLMNTMQERMSNSLSDVKISIEASIKTAVEHSTDSLRNQMATVENIANTLKEKAEAIGDQTLINVVDGVIDTLKTQLESMLGGAIQNMPAVLSKVNEQIENLFSTEMNLLDAATRVATQQLQDVIASGGPEKAIEILQDFRQKIEKILEGRQGFEELLLAPIRSAGSICEGKLKAMIDSLLDSTTDLLMSSLGVSVSVNARIEG